MGAADSRSRERARLVYVVTAPISAQVLLRGQLEWMAARGYDVHLITAEGPGLDEVRSRGCATVHVVDFHREISPLADTASLIQLTRLLRRLQPDIVNYSTPKAALLTALAARTLRIRRRVYVVRGLRLEGARSTRERWLLTLTERVSLWGATVVFTVSASLAEALRVRGLLVSSDVRIPGPGSSNGIDVARSEGADRSHSAAIRDSIGLSNDDVLVGYVGRIAEDKGLDELRLALADERLRHVHLLTVGSVEDAALAQRLRSLGTRWHHVDFTPRVLEHLAAIDVFALPTYREGFPNVVLEASSLGVPVVTTTATGAIDSVVPETTGLLVPPGEVGPLASALTRLAQDPALRSSMGQAGRLFARRFEQSAVWRGYEQAYEEVLV